MTIHLPEDLERYVRTRVDSGRFASDEEAITEAVRLLRQRELTGPPILGEPAEHGSTSTAPETSWERVLGMMAAIPDAEFDRIPTDSSEQLDHYLYGSPKRPTS